MCVGIDIHTHTRYFLLEVAAFFCLFAEIPSEYYNLDIIFMSLVINNMFSHFGI